MTKSDLFRAAHEKARAARATGNPYRTAFATALRAAYAATKAPATIVRSFHAHGGRAWIASITGVDAKFGFTRDFLRKRDVTSSRTNVYRSIEIDIEAREGDVFEWSCQESSRRQERGYWIVREGRLVAADRAAVRQAVA